AALDIDRIVTIRHRHEGTMTRALPAAEHHALIERARGPSTSDRIIAALAVAEACRGDVARQRQVAVDAVEVARSIGEPALLDAALEQLCASQLEYAE